MSEKPAGVTPFRRRDGPSDTRTLPLVICGVRDWPFRVPNEERVGPAPPDYGAVYPCVQNMLLACRAVGPVCPEPAADVTYFDRWGHTSP